ncbi:MAG TPA: glycosyltransferase, partial [Burkholderiaceae bacterium]|nr:glycosyltransferase [Burkholderiaceae bacterium]
MYIDPDIQFFRRLIEVEELFNSGALAVLTPHLTAPLNDDKTPSELSIMRAGVYNCGFVAVANHPARKQMLDWWAQRLEFGAFVDFEAGLFTDQKWIDLAPGLFPDVRVLRHSGYNAAYWNLSHRPFGKTGDQYTAAGEPLVFFHFSGIDPHDPGVFSKHQTRFSESDLGPFRPAFRSYANQLLANGYDRFSKATYAFGRTKAGAPIVPEMRQVFRYRFDIGAPAEVRDPFGIEPSAFDQPTDKLPNAAPRISMLFYEAWRRRDLLRGSFDLSTATGREGLLSWVVAVGERVLGVSASHIRTAQRELERFRASVSAASQKQQPRFGMPRSRLVDALIAESSSSALRAFDVVRRSTRARRLYYQVPPSIREPLHRRMLRALSRLSLMSARSVQRNVTTSETGTGLNLIGYFRGEFSIGECARAFANATLKHGPATALINFEGGLADRNANQTFEGQLSARAEYDVNLCVVNADQTTVLFDALGGSVLRGRYNIGYWFWELERFPPAWARSLSLVDEVWVATRHVHDAVKLASGDKPVRIVPYPIEVFLSRQLSRTEFGLRPQAFTFLFSFDFFSYIDRKNPEAVVAAFQRAFADRSKDVNLVLKSIGAERARERFVSLKTMCADDPRIVILDKSLTRESMWGLQSVCDCYVSLHRAEGLGLGLAESMYLGKPAIGTGYSGNLQFMSEANSCLVDYRLVDIPPGTYVHSDGQQWADPDIDHAAHWMQRIARDSAFRERIATSGQAFIRSQMSASTASQALKSELQRIRDVRAR